MQVRIDMVEWPTYEKEEETQNSDKPLDGSLR
jgi:hypothetical protein